MILSNLLPSWLRFRTRGTRGIHQSQRHLHAADNHAMTSHSLTVRIGDTMTQIAASAIVNPLNGQTTTVKPPLPDELDREVYCILGIPIDAVEMADVLLRIQTAAAANVPYHVSTPNLNFLINLQSDPEFRESLLQSDLCPPDGMPVIWIARIMGLPISPAGCGIRYLRQLASDQTSGWPFEGILVWRRSSFCGESRRRAQPPITRIAVRWNIGSRFHHCGAHEHGRDNRSD